MRTARIKGKPGGLPTPATGFCSLPFRSPAGLWLSFILMMPLAFGCTETVRSSVVVAINLSPDQVNLDGVNNLRLRADHCGTTTQNTLPLNETTLPLAPFPYCESLNIEVLGLGGGGNELIFAGAARNIAVPRSGQISVALHLRRLDDFAETLRQPSGTRKGHTATRLKSGQVLIVGGEDASGTPLGSAELYDPLRASFTLLAGSLRQARSRHTATLLDDGSVLIAGGQGAGSIPILELERYLPQSGGFVGAMSLHEGRYDHVALHYHAQGLTREKVLLAGGHNGTGDTSSAEIYAVGRGVEKKIFMKFPRSGHVAIALTPSLALIAGGHDSSRQCELFMNNETFDANPPSMAEPRRYLGMAPLNENTVILAGGVAPGGRVKLAEFYKKNEGIFADAGQLVQGRRHLTMTALADGSILIAGGVDPDTSAPLSTAECYKGGAFSAVPHTMDQTRSRASATLLEDGTVLLFGGVTEGAATVAEVYAPPWDK